MKQKRILSIILTIALCIGFIPAMPQTVLAEEPTATEVPIYMDDSYSYAERAADLVARMSVAQKGSQVSSQNAPAITAAALGGGALEVPATAGISGYTWWQEALHGYLNGQNSNSYPQNTSVGNTWNPDLYYDVATAISDEIRERAPKGSQVSTDGMANATNLNFYSPTVNMHRDPRWGRNEESYTEDVYLMSKMGTAFVQGMQGMDQDGNLLDAKGRRKLNPTIKHYVANNSERNRLDGGAQSSMRALREYYAAPYRNIIQDADVSSVMTAYSTFNGDPCTWSSYLIETLLRQTYGFSGHMTGDCDSVATIARHNFPNPYTGKTLTLVEQYAQALAHGMDLQCNGGHGSGISYGNQMANMLSQNVETDKGIFTENQLDVSLHRLMTARMQTGEWDTDNTFTTEAADRVATQTGSIGWQTPERLQLIDDVNAEAIVMLKNEVPEGSTEKVLPLAIPESEEYKVVIVGAWQTNQYTGLYSGGQNNNTNRITIQQRIVSNIQEKNPNATITTLTSYGNSTAASSYTITAEDEALIADADAVIVVTGTPENYSREDGDRTSIIFNNGQANLISNVGKINPRTIAVMETCGPMQVKEFENDVAAILWSSFLGNRKVGFGDVITGKVNPSGKITDTWYKNVNDNGESDIPSIYDYDLFPSKDKAGRTYMYFEGTPSYYFGYGLSYSTFKYSNLNIMNNGAITDAFDANDTITVSFDVYNNSDIKGKEITQLYIAQPEAPAELMRPIKQLKGFDKIELEAGEGKTVTLDVKISDLAFYNEAEDRFIVDEGKYQIQVGTNSKDISLTGDINVTGAMDIVPAVLTIKPSQEGDDAIGVEERLIFDKGKKVDAKLTVAMNDESLYGYIIKQQSSFFKPEVRELPAGMEVTYESNRSEVAAVTEDGIVTTGPGVATITVTATYNGESVSNDFVVYVVSTAFIDDIKVNGTSIDGFKKDKMNYSVELPAGTTDVPSIEVVSTNEDVTTEVVEELKSVPGVYVLESTNTITGKTVVYRVGVGFSPNDTDFKAGEAAALAKGWSFKNKNANAVFGEGGLTITTEKGAFANEEAQPQNVFMTSALGDWVAQSHVTLDATPTASNQQAGLVVYDDNNNYIRFVYEYPTSGTTNVIRVYNVVNGVQTQSNSVNMASQTSLYFQIVKEGTVYTFKYSQDGINWSTFGTTIRAEYALPQIGLYATNGDTDAAAITATYENLSVSQLSDLYPRLSDLTINGTQISGFDPTVFAYNVEVKESDTNTPVVEGKSANPAYRIEYNYDQFSNGKGKIAVTVYSSVASATYIVSFNTVPVSEYLADGEIGPKWTVLRENKDAYSIDKGLGLRLPTQRYDIYSTGAAWENVFIQPAMGNWELVAKVFYPHVPTANYQQAMVLVWQDEDNYIRANCQQSTLKLEPGRETNGSFGSIGGGQITADSDGTVTVYHRIKKEGTTYTISYSTDGETYTQLGNPITGVNYSDPKIGFFSTQNSNSTPMNAYFEYLTITNLNGVQQRSYQEMLQEATDNVKDYVAADIPAKISSDYTFAPVPHGYTMSLTSSDPSVIAEDGTITPSASGDKNVTLRVKISDGKRTSESEPILVTVGAGEDPDPEDKDFDITTAFNLETLEANRTLVSNVEVTNKNSDAENVLVITALYDKDEKMINVSYLSKNIPVGATENLNCGFKLPTSIDGHKVKVFVWEGVSLTEGSMVPLSKVVTLQ